MLDRRVLPGEPDVVAGIRALVERATRGRPEVGATVEVCRAMHALQTPADGALVQAVQGAARGALGRELETTYISFGSNAAYLAAEKGWPAVALGPGNIGDVGPNEHVEVRQVEEAARLYALLMTQVQVAPAPAAPAATRS